FRSYPTFIRSESDAFERYDRSLLLLVQNAIELILVLNRDPWQVFLAKRGQRLHRQLAEASAEQTARIRSAHQNPIRSRARELVRSIEAWIYHPEIGRASCRERVLE